MSATREIASPFPVPALRRRQKEDENVADGGVDVARTAESDAALVKAIEALAIKIEQKPAKTVSERAQGWVPTILTCVVLGISTVRFDTAREVKTDTSMITMQSRVEQLEKRDTERKSEIEMWRTYVTSLVIELKSKGIKIPPMPKGE